MIHHILLEDVWYVVLPKHHGAVSSTYVEEHGGKMAMVGLAWEDVKHIKQVMIRNDNNIIRKGKTKKQKKGTSSS